MLFQYLLSCRKLYCLTVRTLREWVFPTCYILLTCCRWWHLIRYHHPTIFVCHIISVPNEKRRYQFYCAWSVSGLTFINYAVYRNMQTSNNNDERLQRYQHNYQVWATGRGSWRVTIKDFNDSTPKTSLDSRYKKWNKLNTATRLSLFDL
jgi:hypothetical protein